MFSEDKGFSGFKRLYCDICKKRKVLVTDKHIGKIVCKKCYKLQKSKDRLKREL